MLNRDLEGRATAAPELVSFAMPIPRQDFGSAEGIKGGSVVEAQLLRARLSLAQTAVAM